MPPKPPEGYFTDDKKLYYVVHFAPTEVLLEDCKTGDPILVPLGEFVKMKLKKVRAR